MTSPRDCPCTVLNATGEFSVRRLPLPAVSYEAVCAACETPYWLSAREAEGVVDAAVYARGQSALAELSARVAQPDAQRERAARQRFAALRPVRDALVLFARRLKRALRRG